MLCHNKLIFRVKSAKLDDLKPVIYGRIALKIRSSIAVCYGLIQEE